MAKVHDVAAYIISKMRHVDAMKLQKLLYYSQAWSLVWDDKHLFHPADEVPGRIECLGADEFCGVDHS